MTTNNNIIWIATVNTREPFTAAAATGEEAVRTACEAALAWLRSRGVSDHETAADVQDYFGVRAIAVPMGGAVNADRAPYYACAL